MPTSMTRSRAATLRAGALLAVCVFAAACRTTLAHEGMGSGGHQHDHRHGHDGPHGHDSDVHAHGDDKRSVGDALTPDERAARIAEADALLKPDTEVVCRKCGMHLTRRRAYMSPPPSEKLVGMREEPALGQSGVVLTFQNAHKKVHGVATFSRADNVHVAAGAGSKGTYFPGYTWAVASCSHCRAHVGWKFVKEEDPATATKKKQQRAAQQAVPPPAPAARAKGKGKKKGRNLKALANLCQTFPQVRRAIAIACTRANNMPASSRL